MYFPKFCNFEKSAMVDELNIDFQRSKTMYQINANVLSYPHNKIFL